MNKPEETLVELSGDRRLNPEKWTKTQLIDLLYSHVQKRKDGPDL